MSSRQETNRGGNKPVGTHKGLTGRAFEYFPPEPCYNLTNDQRFALPPTVLSRLSQLSSSAYTLLQRTEIPACDGVAIRARAGSIIRLSVTHGPQVADLNVWNEHDTNERFYSSKTRQIHATHLTTGDSLWSSFPNMRPLLTIVHDSIAYGIDADNAGVHDVIGSRCDPYTHAMMSGNDIHDTCHSNLTRAIRPFGLSESDVHDVFNVFMCTGFTPDSGVYFSKPSPSRKGDYVDMFAQVDVIVAVSACRQGDVALACGLPGAQPKCYPLGLEVLSINDSQVLQGWKCPKVSSYNGSHGA